MSSDPVKVKVNQCTFVLNQLDQFARDIANTALFASSSKPVLVTANVELSTTSARTYFANGAITLTLPSPVGNSGVRFSIKNIGDSEVKISGLITESNNSNLILSFKNTALELISDNTSWYIF